MSAQLALPIRAGPRRFHPTGLQVACVSCAATGVDKQGLPRDPGGPPLCLPCWTGQQQRAGRKERAAIRAALWEGLGAAEDVTECAACGSDLPSPECFRCGWAWIAELRAQFDAEQEQARLEDLAAADRFALQLGEIAEAQRAVDQLVTWIERCRTALDAAQVGGGRGRPVELVAEAYARLGPVGGRGRPPVWPRVAAVLALDGDWRSGRRARPGRALTAALAGCTEAAVTGAWKSLQACGWADRTEVGGLAPIGRRREGLHRLRAEFDVEQLHRAPAAARAPYRAIALQVYRDLLVQAVDQLAAAEDLVDQLRVSAAAPTSWAEHVQRARLRAAVARCRADIDQRIYLPPPEGDQLETLSSGPYLGLTPAGDENLPSVGGWPRPFGRGQDAPAPRWWSSRGLQHPRTAERQRAKPRARRAPVWAVWAYELARDLRKQFAWLRGESVARVAAVIGPELGPEWTAAEVTAWIHQDRDRPVLDDPGRPRGYLRSLLRAARGALDPPLPGPLDPSERRRALVLAEGIRLWESRTAIRARQAAEAAAAADWPEVARPAEARGRIDPNGGNIDEHH
jgi:hypothetical protein